MRYFDHDDSDRILDGTADRDGLRSGDRQLSHLLDDLRRLRAAEDPVMEAGTVREMKKIVTKEHPRPAKRRRSLKPTGVRVAIVGVAVVLVGTASSAVEESPVSIPGVPEAVSAGGVADSVLAGLGVRGRTDEEDAAADKADLEADKAERAKEAAEQAGAGPGAQQTGDTTNADLPEPAKQGIATADKNRQNALTFTTAMRKWAACVAEKAPLHDPTAGDFDPIAACGNKPAKPAGMGDDDGPETGDENSGRRGPPAGAEPPAGTGPPAKAGPPKGVGPSSGGPPAGAGPPANAGPPEGAGPPAGVGPPVGVGGRGDDEEEAESE